MVLKELKGVINRFDLFCSSELLRYHSQTQYKTVTGGIFSLAIICVVAVGFASMISDTLQRVSITSSLVTQKNSDPPYASLKPGIENMFMMGFSIQSVDLSFQADLNSGPQYFEVSMYLNQLAGGMYSSQTKVPLEQCTYKHWNMVPEFNFDAYNAGVWLCLPLDYQLPLQGAYTSSVMSFLSLNVLPCQNSTSNNNSCASQQEIDSLFQQYGNFYMIWNYVNPVINPNQQDFLSYYVEAKEYIIFSKDIGSEAWVYFSDYSIMTDDSILPYEHTLTTTGCIVEGKAMYHPYTVLNYSSYATVYLAKSENSLVYNRQVQKISAVLSYIGGLVGSITALLFLVKSYTDTSLEVAIGLSLFEINKQQRQKKGQDENKKEKYFNLFGFVGLTFYRLLKFCGWKGKYERAQRLQNCQREALKQMDVQLLLKRVIKLETCMSKLFTPQQLKEIREGQTITFKTAKNMRMLLLKEGQQNQDQEKNSQVESDKKEDEINDTLNVRFNQTEEEAKQKQKSQFESGNSIYKLKPNKYGEFLKPSQLHIEEAKIVTRKAILKRRKQGENEKGQEAKDFNLRNPMTHLQPIVI